MNMMNWVTHIPLETRQAMMRHECFKPFIDEWTWELAIVEPTIIQHIYSQFPLRTKVILHTLLDGIGSLMTEEYILVNTLKEKLHLSGLQCKLALQQLAGIGVCIVVDHPWKQRVWQIPFPIFIQWSRYALQQDKKWWHEQIPDSDHHAVMHYANPTSLGRQLLYFLLRLQQLDMNFTKKGKLSKVTIDQLDQHCLLDEATISRWLRQNMDQSSYSAYITFMLELGTDLGIIVADEKGLKYNYEQLYAWLQLCEWQREHQLMQLVFEACLCQEENEGIIAPLGSLINLPTAVWFTYSETQQELLELWLEVCSQMGWLEWVSTECQLYVRLQSFSFEITRDIVLQDNGEIIVLPELQFVYIWHLEHIAEHLKTQELTIYRLSVHKLKTALLTGYSMNSIQKLLSNGQSVELPHLVKQWLDTASASMTTHAKLVIPILAEENLTLLQTLSIAYWGQWLRLPNTSYYQYEVCNRLVDIVSELVKREHVTTVWYTESRAYHPSTSKKLMEYAIEHELPVQLMIDKVSKMYVPLDIIEKSSSWYVEGVFEMQSSSEPILLFPNDWSAMKLAFN